MYDTRLGAASTIALICIIGILCIPIFGSSAISNMNALVPENQVPEIANKSLAKDNMFGNITIEVQTLAFVGALDGDTCDNIVFGESLPSHLSCTTVRNIFDDSTKQTDMILCSFQIVCLVDNSISGIQNVPLKFPVAFQKMQWNIQPGTYWYNSLTSVNGMLAPRNNKVLSGTSATPTVLNYGIVRGKLLDNSTIKNDISSSPNQTDFGVELAWKGSDVQESNNGPLTPYHYVNFKFSVSENIFNVELRDKQDLFDKCNAVLTLFLGVMAIMHTMKLIVEKGIDVYLRRRAAKNGTEIPEDVLRRQQVLEEHNATANGTHRLPSVAFEMTELGLESRTGSTDKETIVLLQKENQLQSRAITQLQAQGAALLAQVTQQNLAIKQLLAAPTLNLNQEEEKKEKVNVTKARTKGHKSNPTQLPEGWEKTYDANSGVDYYSNATTQESSWNAPPGSTGGSAGLVMRNNPLQTERNEL